MIATLLRRIARLAGLLVPPCALVHRLVAGRWSVAPVVLVLTALALLQRPALRELALRRRPLEPGPLADWIAAMAREAGLAKLRVSVAGGSAAELAVGESLITSGELVLPEQEIASGELYPVLGLAARQVAMMAYGRGGAPIGALLLGAGMGAMTGLYDRLGASPAAGLLGAAGSVAMLIATAYVQTNAAYERGERVTARANELLGWLRTEHPEAFADLARRQGLATAESGQNSAEAAP